MKQALLSDINKRLDHAGFRSGDFVIQQFGTTSPESFRITYAPESRFQLQASISAGKLKGSVIPGSVGEKESFELEKHDFLYLVQTWLEDIREELAAMPTGRALQQHAQEIEQLVGRMNKFPDEYFNKAEADELKAKLDVLRTDMQDRLREAGETEKAIKAKLASVEEDVAFLKKSLDTLKKTGWARSFASRIGGWLRDPNVRGILKDGADIAVKVLGPHVPGS